MAELAHLGISVGMKGGKEAAVDLDRLSAASQKAERATIGLSENAEKAAKRIAGANDNVSKAADKVAASYSAVSRAAQNLSGAIIGSAIGAALTAAVGRLREMEQVNAQVNRALENAGSMAGHSAESIRRWADDLEKSTGRAASEVMAISANLASFGFNEDVFFRAIRLADDMAAAWGGDLRQNLEGLSRALENPEKGLAMLSARGITFTAEGRRMAMQLSATGKAAEAAALLMDELEGQVKGVAEAGFTGLTKASADARRTMDQFFEAIVTKSGIMTALETSLNGASAGMTFLAENADLVMLAFGILTARIAGPFVAAQVSAAASIVKNTYALGMQSTALGRSVAMMGVYDIATRKLNVSLTLATVSVRAFSTALALVGGPAGAAILAIGAALYIASQRAQDARERSEKYAEIIRRAGENSATAGMGIREAAAAYYEVADAATAAERAVSRAAAQADADKLFAELETKLYSFESSMQIASATVQREIRDLVREFKAGSIPVEDFSRKIDDISRLHPNASPVIAELQRIAREAAAALGVIDALNSAAAQVGRTDLATKGDRPGASPMDKAAEDARQQLLLRQRGEGWTGIFSELFSQHEKRMKDAAREAERAKKAYDNLVASAQEFIAAQRLEAEVLGMSEQAANALRYEQDLLNEARRAGINLTPEDIHGFKALAEAMAEAEERTRVLTERFEFMKDLTKGFFTDFKNDLISNMSQGMSFWESAWRAMASAAERAIGKVVDKLLDDLLNAIFEVNRAGSAGGGGGLFGFLGGLFGGGGSSPYLAFSQTGQYLFDSGGHLGSNVIPFGPNTRKLGDRILADSGFGPQHFPAVLKKGESVLTADHMRRTINTINGLTANQNNPFPTHFTTTYEPVGIRYYIFAVPPSV